MVPGHTAASNILPLRLDSKLYDYKIKLVFKVAVNGYEINDEVDASDAEWAQLGGSDDRGGAAIRFTNAGSYDETRMLFVHGEDGSGYLNDSGVVQYTAASSDYKYKIYVKRRF